MKHYLHKAILLLFTLMLLLSIGITASASGDGNIDGGGGGMGQGSSTDVWRNQDGVRVTVVTTDGTIVSTSFDLSNYNIANNILSFGAVCKLQYNSGTPLSPNGFYSYSKPGIALPHIIDSHDAHASIEAIKQYFCSEYAAQLVASKTGIPFDELISGSYKLIIEPIAYFTHGGRNYAMTATEAALYNQMSGGALRSRMPSLTHQNLPLSIFLEVPDLGYPAWTGTTTGKVSDTDILSALGIGIVSYRETPEEPPEDEPEDEPEDQPDVEVQAPDYTYRMDTDVITSITLSSSREVNPDAPASVTFHIDGNSYTVDNIVIPAGGTQIVWAKWHTPSEPTTLNIEISVRGASTAKTTLVAQIVSLEENLPPDPLATDTNPRFTLPSLPSNPQKTTATWSVWSAYWQPKWEWIPKWEFKFTDHNMYCPEGCTESHGTWVDNGEWVDNGNYVFTSTSYSASLNASMEIHPDDIVPTASGDTMKSGYGVKESAVAHLSTNAPVSHYAPAQTAISYFPEFSYGTYWRLLTCSGGNTAEFTFKPNEYSVYGRSVHFTPVWYPDGVEYRIYTYVIDAWTPAGMLSANVSDCIQIQGSLFDDWYTRRE